MTAVLGISAFYHDSAAALLVDGEIVAAAQEERFTRKKHDHRFPAHAVEYCLSYAKLTDADLDYVGFYDKPLLKFDRLLETYLAHAPRGFGSFLKGMPVWLRQKLHLPSEMRKSLPGYTKKFVFPTHHESHAASAFFPSPFEEATILTVDGVGEWSTATVGFGTGNRIELSHEMRFPHSLGLLYSAFTYYCGFKVNSGEYKLMGLAPYGEPVFFDLILEQLMDLKPDGSFRLRMEYFDYCHGLRMTNKRFAAMFGQPVRAKESPITQHYMDVAASVQKVTEEIVLRMARFSQKLTGSRNLCLAGGVALNCVANGRLLREGPFDDIWIQPAAGDAGGALGAATMIWHQLLDKPRRPQKGDSQKGSRLGPEYDRDEILQYLDSRDAVYIQTSNENDLYEQVVSCIVDGKVVGWFQGRMEYGPRALGGRSIIGDPRNKEMQSKMNLKIKFRESFRPFAPSVLEDRVTDYFDMKPSQSSPYMLFVAAVDESKRLGGADSELQGLDKLKEIRSEVPAITHVDHSARLQTVDEVRHGRFYKLIRRFEERTGCPLMVNTSFNVRGEPIVCTPSDAYRCFMGTDMDVLVLGDFILHKAEQPQAVDLSNEAYLGQFELD